MTFELVPRGRIVGLAFGAMRSARRGAGSDVAGSRRYVSGDDVKAIDWGSSARLSSARNSDEFILRERFAEEAPRVVVICDRRPEMQLFPRGFPWLRKVEAQRAAIELIRASAIEAHGFLGYLDFGESGDEPFWLPPQSQSLWEYQDREAEGAPFRAPESNVEHAFNFLMSHPRSVPAGTFDAVKTKCVNGRTGETVYEVWYSEAVKQMIRERTLFSYGWRERELIGMRLYPDRVH